MSLGSAAWQLWYTDAFARRPEGASSEGRDSPQVPRRSRRGARAARRWKTRSTKPELHLEICNNCHPFFTGRQKLIDTEGRVERFTKRFGAQTSESRKAAAKAAKKQPPPRRRPAAAKVAANGRGRDYSNAQLPATAGRSCFFDDLSLEPRQAVAHRRCGVARPTLLVHSSSANSASSRAVVGRASRCS